MKIRTYRLGRWWNDIQRRFVWWACDQFSRPERAEYLLYHTWRRWPGWAKWVIISPAGVVPEYDDMIDEILAMDELFGGCGGRNPIGIYRGRAWPRFWLARVEVK